MAQRDLLGHQDQLEIPGLMAPPALQALPVQQGPLGLKVYKAYRV